MSHRKPGPKTPWQERARYLKSRCEKRLKPNQVHELIAADAFARWTGFPLNTFLTISFADSLDPRATFQRGQDQLSKQLRRRGRELRWLYVWERKPMTHLHALLNCPQSAREAVKEALVQAFPDCNIWVGRRIPGNAALSYICKGVDPITHAKAMGRTKTVPSAQGIIEWKRCGSTHNLSQAARAKASFGEHNCAEISPRAVSICTRPETLATRSKTTEANPSLISNNTSAEWESGTV